MGDSAEFVDECGIIAIGRSHELGFEIVLLAVSGRLWKAGKIRLTTGNDDLANALGVPCLQDLVYGGKIIDPVGPDAAIDGA